MSVKSALSDSAVKRRLAAFIFCCWAALLFSGCRGYHLGNQYLYRSDIRTVHVEMFESSSDRRFLGQRLTEAITKQIISSTPLTITEPSLADSFIRGKLLRESKLVTGESFTDEARSIDVANRVEIQWVDRAGTSLMPRETVTLDFDAELIPEGGQSLATTQQEIIDRIAREVVGQMEMPW